ncbi:MAG: shikimate kinase [Bacteroidales bacterium]
MIIALTGFMGSGKSTYGKRASELSGFRFIDLDTEIESIYGSISTIFADSGESFFRNKEKETLKKILKKDENIILALGGGTVMDEENVLILKQTCTVVWLKTPIEMIIYEISKAPERPLLKGKSVKDIEELFSSRVPFYKNAAKIIIETKNKSVEEVAKEISKINPLSL